MAAGETALFLIAQPQDLGTWASLVRELTAAGTRPLLMCLGKAAGDGWRTADQALFDRCAELGIRPEDTVMAFRRALPGELSPWSHADQLRELARRQPSACWYAPHPEAEGCFGKDGRALGIAALRLQSLGLLGDLRLVALGKDGMAEATDELPSADELEAAWVAELAMAQRALASECEELRRSLAQAEAERDALAGELEALTASKAYRMGAALASPYRKFHDRMVGRHADK